MNSKYLASAAFVILGIVALLSSISILQGILAVPYFPEEFEGKIEQEQDGRGGHEDEGCGAEDAVAQCPQELAHLGVVARAHEEGAGEVTRTMLIESVSRHFLTWIDGWMNEGFKGVHENWLGRVVGSDQDITICHAGASLSGRVTGMDEDGNLLFTPANEQAQAFALTETVTRHP